MEKPSDTIQPHTLPQSAVFVEGSLYASRDLAAGRWTARIRVAADHAEPLCGEIEFTVYYRQNDRQLIVGQHDDLGAIRLPVECV